MRDSLESLEEVSHLVALKSGWDDSRRRDTLRDYECYLHGAASCNDLSAFANPTLDVDLLWHEHMLHSQLYMDYCRQNFGRYIHHVACIPARMANELTKRIGRKINVTEEDATMNAGCAPEDHVHAACSPEGLPERQQGGGARSMASCAPEHDRSIRESRLGS